MSEADRPNQMRAIRPSPAKGYAAKGVWPVKRRRGYYRALKRKEEWALEYQRDPYGATMRVVFGPLVRDLLFKENPLLALVTKSDNFAGKYIPVPIEFQKEK